MNATYLPRWSMTIGLAYAEPPSFAGNPSLAMFATETLPTLLS